MANPSEPLSDGPGGPTDDGEAFHGESDARRRHADELIIEALADGGDYSAAARRSGRSARTVRRRMCDADFRAEVARRRAERVGELTGLLVSLSRRAVATLEECLEAERPADRIRAAQAVLSEVRRFRDQVDIEERLRQLEDAAAADPAGGEQP